MLKVFRNKAQNAPRWRHDVIRGASNVHVFFVGPFLVVFYQEGGRA